MIYRSVLPANLALFDGGAPGAAPAAGGGNTSGGGTSATPGSTPAGPQGNQGRAPAGASRNPGAASDSASADAGQTGKNSPGNGGASQGSAGAGEPGADKRSAFRALIGDGGEYRDAFAAEVQDIINRRFRENREAEEKQAAERKQQAEASAKVQALLDVLGPRYGIDSTAGDAADAIRRKLEADDELWAEEAERKGMSLDQLRAQRKMDAEIAAIRRENARYRAAEEARQREAGIQATMQRLKADGDALKGKYPGFDLSAELKNPAFLELMKSGVTMETAYRTIHLDDIVRDAQAETEKRVTENIKARGSRPMEAGAGGQSAFTETLDISKLSRAEMDEIKRRVLRGEKVTL